MATLAGSNQESKPILRFTKDFVNGDYFEYETDDFGQPQQLLKTNPPYDARQRPWFIAAEAAKTPQWSAVYSFFTDRSLDISASRLVYDQAGQLLSVLSTDLTLIIDNC